MKFGLFTLGPVPKPLDRETWDVGQEHARFHEWLEQASIADALGYDYCFVGEHHFLQEYTHMSAPETFMGAVTQRTQRIRLGTALMHISNHHNHPYRVAERVSMLDILSNGRWEFGSGPAGPMDGTGMYGVPDELAIVAASASDIWEEGLRECVRMMTEEPYTGFQGTHFQIPGVTVVPRPFQAPHPPLWRSAIQPGSFERCAQLGLGSLMLAAFGAEMIRGGVEEYWAGIRKGVQPIGKAVNPATAVFIHAHCAKTDDEAVARGLEGIDFFSYGIIHSGLADKSQLQHHNRDFSTMRDGGDIDSLPLPFGKTALVGSPRTLREALVEVEKTNVDVVNFVFTTGATRHEDILDSMELVATEVLPEFRDRHEQHERWRAQMLDDVPFDIRSTV